MIGGEGVAKYGLECVWDGCAGNGDIKGQGKWYEKVSFLVLI